MEFQNIYFEIKNGDISDIIPLLNSYDNIYPDRQIIDAEFIRNYDNNGGGKVLIKYKYTPEYINQIKKEVKMEKEKTLISEELAQENVELKAYMDVNEDFKTAWEELKAENSRLKEELTELEEKFLTLNGKSYSYYMTLQEIKKIAETELSYDMVGNEHRHYKNYDIIRHLITKAEEE